jgi:hypothetical protein
MYEPMANINIYDIFSSQFKTEDRYHLTTENMISVRTDVETVQKRTQRFPRGILQSKKTGFNLRGNTD